jgi:hypothetical protein
MPYSKLRWYGDVMGMLQMCTLIDHKDYVFNIQSCVRYKQYYFYGSEKCVLTGAMENLLNFASEMCEIHIKEAHSASLNDERCQW